VIWSDNTNQNKYKGYMKDVREQSISISKIRLSKSLCIIGTSMICIFNNFQKSNASGRLQSKHYNSYIKKGARIINLLCYFFHHYIFFSLVKTSFCSEKNRRDDHFKKNIQGAFFEMAITKIHGGSKKDPRYYSYLFLRQEETRTDSITLHCDEPIQKYIDTYQIE